MMSLYNQTQEKQETNFYKGKKALKTVFEDQLKSGTKEILVLGASEEAENILPFYFKWYNKTRTKKKIPTKVVQLAT